MITGKDLLLAGWQSGPILGLALATANKLGADPAVDHVAILKALQACRENPEAYADNSILAGLAQALIADREAEKPINPPPLGVPLNYRIWGQELIDPEAVDQMNVAMSLPITSRGALMPDAHVGYGLPIGGVLETVDSVIPYAVGSDIACRMRITIVDAGDVELDQKAKKFGRALLDGTFFGAGRESTDRPDSDVLDREEWGSTPLLRSLKEKARRQLGTSGSGNHFVEWGTVEGGFTLHGSTRRKLVALMSHSGSRGVGFKIADYYSKAAEAARVRDLPPKAIKLSWLALDSELGQDYWAAMNLAGEFASENHRVIHERVLKLAGLSDDILAVIENHHNFAWPEERDGHIYVTHRKGATPAGTGVMGVIPGSMATPGYIVQGRGNAESLESASHGAGRRMGRRQAERTLSAELRDKFLKQNRVTLFGGGLDEAPQAYKAIEKVIEAQRDLVEVIATFTPRIVHMDTGKEDI